MNDAPTIEILKRAILLEKRGQAFYRHAAAQAKNKAVRDFFERMADEEQGHLELLSRQFKSYQKEKQWRPTDYAVGTSSQFADAIISAELQDRISAADFEAAAISAAIQMEKQSIQLYREQAQAAVSSDEKALFEWLADWEAHHYNFLAEMDRALTEKIWHDNRFWPF